MKHGPPSLPAVSPHSLALAAAVLSAGVLSCGRKVANAAQAGKDAADPTVAARVLTVEQKPMPRYLTLTGALRAERETEVAADATGKVTKTLVERGQAVRFGDVLVVLDARTASISARVARAQEEVQKHQAELARLECDRGQRLLAAGSITRADYDRRMSQCRSSKAALAAAQDAARLARKAVSDASIRAPFAGVIGERFVNVGQYVRPDSRIVSLFAIDPLRLELTVPEAEVGAVRKDTKVVFRVAAYNENFTGVVRFISPNVREKSRDLVVEAVVRNPDGRVKPGMFAVARIAAGEAPAPVLPASAVRRGEVDSRVFAVEEGRAAERIVQLGEERDGWVAVQSGVRAGDKVVASPDEQIRDGVKIVEQN